MRLIIEARLEDAVADVAAPEAVVVAVLNRSDRSLAKLGLSLAEGRALLATVQSTLVKQQATA